MTTSLKKAVFLDRDGVLNVDLGYTYRPIDLKLVPGMIDGLKRLKQANFVLIMITNQSGIARGMFTYEHVHNFNSELIKQIQREIPGFVFDAIMICPHHPDGKVEEFAIECECRKPKTKLVMDAAKSLQIDLSQSWLVGDKDSDIECALNARMKGIQVVSGGKQYKHSSQAHAIVPTLKDAAEIILSY